eukprot:822399-Amphidinium_carterae.1
MALLHMNPWSSTFVPNPISSTTTTNSELGEITLGTRANNIPDYISSATCSWGTPSVCLGATWDTEELVEVASTRTNIIEKEGDFKCIPRSTRIGADTTRGSRLRHTRTRNF